MLSASLWRRHVGKLRVLQSFLARCELQPGEAGLGGFYSRSFKFLKPTLSSLALQVQRQIEHGEATL